MSDWFNKQTDNFKRYYCDYIVKDVSNSKLCQDFYQSQSTSLKNISIEQPEVQMLNDLEDFLGFTEETDSTQEMDTLLYRKIRKREGGGIATLTEEETQEALLCETSLLIKSKKDLSSEFLNSNSVFVPGRTNGDNLYLVNDLTQEEIQDYTYRYKTLIASLDKKGKMSLGSVKLSEEL